MLTDARHLAASIAGVLFGLASPVGAVQMANLADLCAESGAGPVMEDTLVLRTTEMLPLFCEINLVDSSLRIIGASIVVPQRLSIVRAGTGAVEITGSTIETTAFSIINGDGPVRIVDSALSGDNNSEIDISGDIRMRRAALSLETGASATFLILATDEGTIDITTSSLSARAHSFGLIEMRAPGGLSLRSSELVAQATWLIPEAGSDVAFANNKIASIADDEEALVVSLLAGSDPGTVTLVSNTFADGAIFRFEAGVLADRCVIRANQPATAIVGAEAACP